ncbi:transmembrane and tetratricopeptide repeat containing 4 [Salpingoeca rosetta]|uniref:dolichyl-phosphate-mannose--protein mannosyltransferase n=1 Tax=Salpingoeca rosetta (strain ATCC 50818 / BSB-021) TaxID=946362 RepID=F2UH04_SALR5|nr:transmembrane and tetratricopeptide repeat containing 4 [Salpingoeca rosetta]EGD76403.1 transmembrane and tetratricopeptide repeat containing 4 [Salpingoeca rosetta]|eukprot:XP_004991318.1 transmembrane and tetratricopeptide repeat containing 4 [Salpingoeca rosetta]
MGGSGSGAGAGAKHAGGSTAKKHARGKAHDGKHHQQTQLKLWHAMALVAAAAILVYLNSLHGEFVFDDMPAIVDNADVDPSKTPLSSLFKNNFWGQEMGAAWSQHYSYRPLTTITFRWNVAVFGFDTFWFHVVNTALHALASALVTCVAAQLCKGFASWVPLVCGLVFAVHPVHTEAVANIVCRAELLACVFWCLAFLVYAKGMSIARTQAAPVVRQLTFFLALGATTALTVTAVLCKEQGFTVLPVVMVYDLLYHGDLDLVVLRWFRRPQQQQQQQAKKHKSTNTTSSSSLSASMFRVAVAAGAMAVVYGWRVSLNSGDEVKVDEKTNPANHIDDWLLRALTKNYYVFLHAWLLLFPAELCCDWSSFGIPNITAVSDPRNVQTAAMYTTLVLGVVYAAFNERLPRRLRRVVLMAVAIAAIAFIPASGLLLEVGFVVAERVLYTPCLGACLLFAAVTAHALNAYTTGHDDDDDDHRTATATAASSTTNDIFTRRAVFAGVAAVLLLMSARTWLRNYDWQNVLTLYETGLQVLPMNAKLNHNFAHSTPDPDKKEYHYRAAIHIYPPYASAYINLGVHLAQTSRLAEAVDVWKQGLQQWNKRPIVGSDPVVLNLNIGTGLKNLGRYEEAKGYLRACLRYDANKELCSRRLQEVEAALRRNK